MRTSDGAGAHQKLNLYSTIACGFVKSTKYKKKLLQVNRKNGIMRTKAMMQRGILSLFQGESGLCILGLLFLSKGYALNRSF